MNWPALARFWLGVAVASLLICASVFYGTWLANRPREQFGKWLVISLSIALVIGSLIIGLLA